LNTAKLIRTRNILKQSLDPVVVTQIARNTGFTVRIRDVQPAALANTLIYNCGARKTETLADLQRTFNALTGKTVHYKPFHNQLAKPAFPEFFREILSHLLGRMTLKTLKPVPTSALAQFKDIIIQDGSSFALKDSLKTTYPGRFTTISPAAVELHATMSVFADQPITIWLSPDSQAERDFLPVPESLRNKLFLGDRGYEDTEYVAQVRDAGGHVIIRCKGTLNPVVKSCWVSGRVPRSLRNRSLKEILGKLRGKHADLDVEWSRKKSVGTLRLVLIWNPKFKRHMYLVTNLDRETFTAEMVRTLYRLRWQVELLFKEWKSYANLHAFPTGKAGIAEGLMWAALAAALLKRFLAHSTQLVFPGVEISTRRTSMAVTEFMPELIGALLSGRGLLRTLRCVLLYLSTQALRAHPKRDRIKGRLQLGLEPVSA